MPLVLGYPTGSEITLVACDSTPGDQWRPSNIARTTNPDQAMRFLDPADACIFLESMRGQTARNLVGHTLNLYADHDLELGPMGTIRLDKIAEHRDGSPLLQAVYTPSVFTPVTQEAP